MLKVWKHITQVKQIEISGIEISEDDKTITINYLEASPSLMSGIWTAPVARHYVGDVTTGELTIDDIVESEKIRTTPIGFGPYKVEKVVPGESVQYARNEDYWKGKPALESIVLKVVNTASVLKELEAGEIDIAKFQRTNI